MNDQKITFSIGDLAKCIDLSSQAPCLFEQLSRPVTPRVSIDLQGILLPDERTNAKSIGCPEILTERVELHIEPEAIDRLRGDLDLLAKILHRLSQRIAADLHLAILYGVTSYGAVPGGRGRFERILPPLIDSQRFLSFPHNPAHSRVTAPSSQEPPRQEPENHG